MVDHERLGDHATHRGSDDVGARDAELAEQTGRIVRHVLHAVGGRGCVAAEERRDLGQSLELGRQAAVPVVEADDEEAALAQTIDETLGAR